MTCSQNTSLAAVLAVLSLHRSKPLVHVQCIWHRCGPHISYAWVKQQSRVHRGSCNRYPILPGQSDTTPSLLRLATSTLDLDGVAPSLCLMPTVPSTSLHIKTRVQWFLPDLPASGSADPYYGSSACCPLGHGADKFVRQLGGTCEVKSCLLPHHKHKYGGYCLRELIMPW